MLLSSNIFCSSKRIHVYKGWGLGINRNQSINVNIGNNKKIILEWKQLPGLCIINPSVVVLEKSSREILRNEVLELL